MVISDFLFILFWPHNLKFQSSQKNYKIQNLERAKNGLYALSLYTNNRTAKFQSNIFIFGCAMARNRYLLIGDVVTFWNAILAFIVVVRTNKWNFWTLIQNWARKPCFCQKILSLIWPSFTCNDLSSGKNYKWISPSDSVSKLTHKTFVARHSCHIFIS